MYSNYKKHDLYWITITELLVTIQKLKNQINYLNNELESVPKNTNITYNNCDNVVNDLEEIGSELKKYEGTVNKILNYVQSGGNNNGNLLAYDLDESYQFKTI